MKVQLLIILSFFSIVINAQDIDEDGINDQLEKELALLFAPEWRFNRQLPADVENSNQNKNEAFFPSSVEWLLANANDQLHLKFKYGGKRNKVLISDMSQLTEITDPIKRIQSDDSFWRTEKKAKLWIDGYPEYLNGDPSGFPTYFHCRTDGQYIRIEYFLWFPFDYKEKNPGLLRLFKTEMGKHRGDWEYLVVFVKNVSDLNTPFVPTTAKLHAVIFGGHGPPPKRVQAESSSLNLVNCTHPQVFVAYGSHAMYPEPGIWRNYRLPVVPDTYDDMFNGNGLRVQSWDPKRNLINLGETHHPFVNWLNFKGKWGPDKFFSTSSPPSPPYKGAWKLKLENCPNWDSIKFSYSKYYRNPVQVNNHLLDQGWKYESKLKTIFFNHSNWQSSQAVYPIILEEGNYPSLIQDKIAVGSILFLGKAEIRLYPQKNYQGEPTVIDNSVASFKNNKIIKVKSVQIVSK